MDDSEQQAQQLAPFDDASPCREVSGSVEAGPDGRIDGTDNLLQVQLRATHRFINVAALGERRCF